MSGQREEDVAIVKSYLKPVTTVSVDLGVDKGLEVEDP